MFQDVINTTMHDKFMPSSRDELLIDLLLNLDDDKVHYNYLSKRKVKMGQDSKPKRVHHVRDNRNWFTNHVISYKASDMPIASQFKQEEESLFGCAVYLIRLVLNI